MLDCKQSFETLQYSVSVKRLTRIVHLQLMAEYVSACLWAAFLMVTHCWPWVLIYWCDRSDIVCGQRPCSRWRLSWHVWVRLGFTHSSCTSGWIRGCLISYVGRILTQLRRLTSLPFRLSDWNIVMIQGSIFVPYSMFQSWATIDMNKINGSHLLIVMAD